MRLLFVIFLCLPGLLAACSTSLKNPYSSQATDSSMSTRELAAAKKMSRTHWVRRHQRDSLKEFLSSQRLILNSSSRDESDFIRMARGEFLFAEYFATDTQEKIRHFGESANWAEMVMLQNPIYKKAWNEGNPDDAISSLKRKDVQGLFWYASALEKWSTLSGVGTTLHYQARIRTMMERVNQLRPDYFFGGAHRFFGIHYALQPGMEEEDLILSRKHFERALKTAPNFFGNHVSFAEAYAGKIDHSSLMKKHLELAARGDIRSDFEYRSEQILEQTRARNLLKEGNDDFHN